MEGKNRKYFALWKRKKNNARNGKTLNFIFLQRKWKIFMMLFDTYLGSFTVENGKQTPFE